MRTTIDLDDELLAAVRERAAKHRTSLSRVVGDAVKAYLEASPQHRKEPFELIVAGIPGGRYPEAKNIGALLAAEDDESYVGG